MSVAPGSNQRGALWILASAVCFTLMATLIKGLDQYPATLKVFYSAIASCMVLTPIILRSPRQAFVTSRPVLMITRCGLSAGGVTLAYYSYQHLPLAQANALSFTRALWIVPLAAVLLGEKIGWLRVIALLTGFGGVLLVVRPSADASLGWAHAAALASAVMIALTVTGIKALTRTHSATAIMSWSAVLGVVFTAPGALLNWRWPDLDDLALLILMGASSVGAQICYIRGMSEGDASAMASVDYSRLLFAVAVGALLFHEVLGLTAYAGMTLIVLSTGFVAFRGRAAAARQISPP
ncbi:MAG: DMT family transporter [Caulobacter sp.]|nr:DMT family transporter [Caulobacter sp.]